MTAYTYPVGANVTVFTMITSLNCTFTIRIETMAALGYINCTAGACMSFTKTMSMRLPFWILKST